MEPGLSSPAAFQPAAAAVRPGRGAIVPQSRRIVKCLANSFGKGYTKENITIGETTIDRKQIAQIKTIYNWEN